MIARFVGLPVMVGAVLLASACGGDVEKSARPTPSQISSTPLERVKQALLPIPPEVGGPTSGQYGPESGYFDGLMANALRGGKRPEPCAWRRMPPAQVNAAAGPVSKPAAVAMWTDRAHSVTVQETIVNLPDAVAAKLISTKVARHCRVSRVRVNPVGMMRMQVIKEVVRHNRGRIERLTAYRLAGSAGYISQLDCVIRVKGHVVFLGLSQEGTALPPDTFRVLVDKAGERAESVLGAR